MPDASLPDDTVLTETYWDTYVREQLVTICTSSTRPAHVSGRLISETDTGLVLRSDGSSWGVLGGAPVAVSSPFTAATGWTLSGTQYGWRIGLLVQIRCSVERTGGTITVSTEGNFSNTVVGTFAAGLRGTISAGLPVSSAATGRVAVGSYVPSTGEVSLAAVGGTADILNGDLIELGGVVLVG